MKFGPYTKDTLAFKRQERRLLALGYKRHETDWEIARGSMQDREIIDAIISTNGKYVYTKIGKRRVSGAPTATLFAIESGNYSDYHVVGIYDTKEKAERILSLLNDDDAAIVERTLNPGFDEINAGLKMFQVSFLKNGDVSARPAEHMYNLEPYFSSLYNGYHLSVYAKDEAHAIKIGAEKVAEAKALETLNVKI